MTDEQKTEQTEEQTTKAKDGAQTSESKPGSNGAENTDKSRGVSKLLIITIALCALVIAGTLLAVYFTQSRQTSLPGTVPDTETEPVKEEETLP